MKLVALCPLVQQREADAVCRRCPADGGNGAALATFKGAVREGEEGLLEMLTRGPAAASMGGRAGAVMACSPAGVGKARQEASAPQALVPYGAGGQAP